MGRNERDGGPGRPWVWLLGIAVPEPYRDAALGDADEEFRARRARDGVRAARAWYRRQAIRSLGPGMAHAVRVLGEEWRSMDSRGEGMTMWMQDLRIAARTLARRPGFTVAVALMLGLGVGATTALFGVFRAVFLEPVALPDSDELVLVMQTASFGCCGPSSGPDYLDWVERERSFDGMAAISPRFVNLTSLDEPRRVYATVVTPSAFPMLGVEPRMGRGFTEEDTEDGGVVMLSHTLWSSVLGADPDVLGSTLEVDGNALTVVGVMPEGFDVPSPWSVTLRHQLYMPFPREWLENNRGSHGFPVIARLSDDGTVEAAQADMERIMAELAAEYPRTNADRSARVFQVHEYLYGDVGRQLGLILAAAALVLLIACGNVAGLQLARAAARESELSVRAALGASRWTVGRLLFSESALLAAGGGALGVLLAFLGLGLLRSLLPSTMPRAEGIALDGAALVFALGTAVVTAVVFGIAPALLAARRDLASGVREGGYGTLAPGKERLRDAFIATQIALGLVLANGAVLLVRSYTEVRGQEYGFHTEGVLTMAVTPAGERYRSTEARERYLDDIQRRIADVPGVEEVGFVTRLPLEGGSNGNVLVEGRGPRTSADQGPLVEVTSARGDYFEAMGIPLLRGRTLLPVDSATDAIGVVVNQAMVDEVWPDEDPIGKRFSFSDDPPSWLTVVGVVGSVRQWSPERPPVAQLYAPYSRGWSGTGHVVARMAGDPSEIVPEVRRAALSVDPTQPPSDLRSMDERLEARLSQRRFYTTLIGLFAGGALLLAAAGIYGTVTFFVTRRVRELGIRMALGAGRTGIVGLVLRRGVRLVVWGLVLGLAGVWASTSVLETLVYGVGATDPLALVLGCLTLAAVALAASTLPALRAARVPPVLALRSE